MSERLSLIDHREMEEFDYRKFDEFTKDPCGVLSMEEEEPKRLNAELAVLKP